MRKNIVALVLAASCGGAAQMAIDAGDGDGGSGSADAAPTPLTPLTVTCVDHTANITTASGTRTEITNSIASFPDINVGDDFEVRQCDYMTLPAGAACAAGNTCTGSANPPGQNCVVTRSGGTFIAGKLVVYCGSTVSSYAAGGALLNSYGNRYGSTTVLH